MNYNIFNSFKSTAAALTVMCAPVCVMAQGYTAAGLEKLKQEKLWFHSSNAAGQVFDNTRNYSEVALRYSFTDGNFHRPQQGKSQNSFDVDCEGFMNLGNAFVWGEFSFEQRNINGSRFNASICDPFRGMPFFMADEHSSDWRNQYYDMKFRASTPLYWGKLSFGFEGAYRASIAAKQLDPRVDSRYFQLEVVPGIAWKITDKHNLGADFKYSALKEDSRMSNVNATVPQTYYLLYGLGVAAKNIGDGENLNYHGHILGGGLQYNFHSGVVNILASADYSRRAENFDRDYTNPKKDAGVDDNVWDFSVNTLVSGNVWTNQFKLRGAIGNLKGIQYINEFDNTDNFNGWVDLARNVRSEFKTQTLGADYSLMRNRDNEYVWRVDAGLNYVKRNDEYILPNSVRDSENLYAGVDFKYNFNLGNTLRRRFLVGAGGGFNSNLSGKYVFGGVNPESPVVTELETLDQRYLTSDWYNLKVSAEYSQQISKRQKMNFFGRAELNYVKTSSFDFNRRSTVEVAVGVNF